MQTAKTQPMIDTLLKRIKEAGAPTEADTERDGAFSYSGEVHGFVVGFYHGFVDFKDWGGLPEGYAKGKNIEKGWYPKGGYIAGAVTRVSCYLLIGYGVSTLV